ncbi:MAG: hypothetical protein KGZ42_03890 [Melioribacter sp.]|nr:hypothetical protein [Melioribacter sp.]
MATRVINVSEIESGMELTEPVKNRNGQVLLGSGLILEEKHKLILKTWGIKKISIKSESEETASPNYELSEEGMSILKNRINWQPRNYQESELIELALIFNDSETI